MINKISTKQLGKIQETLIIPLLGRVQVSKRNTGFFYDKKALEIVAQLEYDYSKFDAAFPTLEGSVLRTRVIDKWLSDLLKCQANTCVVELGCGLNTRCDRLDNGQAMWYDLDLEDVHEIWQHFFEESPRRQFLPYSAFDETWMLQVKEQHQGPFVFIMEGSIVYFNEKKVQTLWALLSKHFPNSHLIFDTVNHAWLNQQNKNHAMKAVQARLKWGIDDIYNIEKWNKNYRILKHESLLFPSKDIRKIYPWWILASSPFAKLLYGDAVSGYFVNMAFLR